MGCSFYVNLCVCVCFFFFMHWYFIFGIEFILVNSSFFYIYTCIPRRENCLLFSVWWFLLMANGWWLLSHGDEGHEVWFDLKWVALFSWVAMLRFEQENVRERRKSLLMDLLDWDRYSRRWEGLVEEKEKKIEDKRVILLSLITLVTNLPSPLKTLPRKDMRSLIKGGSCFME